MAEDLAEGRMRYRMGCWHVGLVLWINDPQQVEAPDEAIPAVRSAAGSRSALVARACARSRWIWLSGASVPDLHGVEKALATTDEVRAAVGRPGRGLEGFRSSHQDALAAQALVIRLGSNRRLTVYADVEEVTEFDEFVPQDDGSQVVGDDPLGDLRLWRAAPRRVVRGAGTGPVAWGSENRGAPASPAEAEAVVGAGWPGAVGAWEVAAVFAPGVAAAHREQHSITCHQRASRSVTTARTTGPSYRQDSVRVRPVSGSPAW
ncbi:hypothetical protein ACFSNO_03200 [Streptomyces cirratus]